ncbi:hypothetical protein C2E23DRAFT_18837 [Lenzites betulinus]|nr:hypothetical protein C2E23DRAFT_18837 [Lenzites betulinus]
MQARVLFDKFTATARLSRRTAAEPHKTAAEDPRATSLEDRQNSNASPFAARCRERYGRALTSELLGRTSRYVVRELRAAMRIVPGVDLGGRIAMRLGASGNRARLPGTSGSLPGNSDRVAKADDILPKEHIAPVDDSRRASTLA